MGKKSDCPSSCVTLHTPLNLYEPLYSIAHIVFYMRREGQELYAS